MPGRGACCCACPGAGRVCCCCKRATMSGRGGTIGRAAGCPARFGRGCGRKGVPGVGDARGADAWGADAGDADACGAEAGDADASLGDDGARGAVRATGWAVIVTDAGGRGTAGVGAGRGCRGPDKIWPGRGVGTGRAGTGPVRNGGCSGAVPPADNGGLKGAGLLRSGSSVELPGVLTGVVTGASCAAPAVEADAGASTSGTGILAVCV
jgi:hypothetical protein